ncbi:transcriptional regulator [Alteribacter lacisalsi]|uniref:Transcriptional regulator n=1 Tax=Alteribacter lacisalsi TaxID=2045244 RepID=A0A2W0H4G1_9BACI|nr:metalloregulator ArsR/SmtB family transcription factor [Alteribacter lacisalsi]PYZ95496.1 transcriptional regulator [Alteribacter lacisalsi]
MTKEQTDTCEIYAYDEQKTARAATRMNQDEIRATSAIFKVLGDENRFKAAWALTIEEELCVCDVAVILGSSTATASHHLRKLSKIGLAKSRKEGKLVFYSLDDDHVRHMITLAMEHQQEGKSR